MRILVAISNYGIKNDAFAQRLINEYRAMPFKVDINILSERPKDYGPDVKVLVGLPSKNPWSLPFAHKRLFFDHADNYDLFIYSEDDTLIRARNIEAFVAATKAIGGNFLPGFVRYELYPNGSKNYPDVFGSYHWLPNSVREVAGYTFAQFSNDHSAGYMLTRAQLRDAIASGGFLVPPHAGRYDLICSAGVDPYTQCGFSRIICFSHLHDFEVHHLSNAYLNRVGLDEDSYRMQLDALLEVLAKKRSSEELFTTEKALPTPVWDKCYYEPCRNEILQYIPDGAAKILSVGCGWGATESRLLERGKRVAAIPLDSVIGRLCEHKGIEVLPPNFARAFRSLRGRKFDAILISEILQHVADPIGILSQLNALLATQGVLIGSVANLDPSRRFIARLLGRRWARLSGRYEKTRLNMTSAAKTRKWLLSGGFDPLEMRYENLDSSGHLSTVADYLPGMVAASNIAFLAQRRETCIA